MLDNRTAANRNIIKQRKIDRELMKKNPTKIRDKMRKKRMKGKNSKQFNSNN